MQLGMVAARPGPGVERGKALRVDLDDTHLSRRRAVEQFRPRFDQSTFEWFKSAGETKHASKNKNAKGCYPACATMPRK